MAQFKTVSIRFENNGVHYRAEGCLETPWFLKIKIYETNEHGASRFAYHVFETNYCSKTGTVNLTMNRCLQETSHAIETFLVGPVTV